MLGTFPYSRESFGGTEYMGRNWHRYISQSVPKFKNYISLILPGQVPSENFLYASKKEMIVWMHNTPEQFGENEYKILTNKRFYEKVKYFIVVSETHKQTILKHIPAQPEQVYIISNAIHPLKYEPNKFKNINQIKLINTSTADRGMDVLYDGVISLKKDFRLEIYNNYNPDLEPEEKGFDSRVRFFGKTPKATVIEALERAHIHAYPSTYPETFCISQAEAMSAGLLCITSDIGALPEVSGGLTTMYPYEADKEKHAKVFAEKLSEAIDTIRSGNWNPEAQIEYINKTYSWKAVKEKWLEFHELL